jgi:ketosteroid isomerase-like protein
MADDDLKRSIGIRSSVNQQLQSGAMFRRACDRWGTGLRSGLDNLGGADMNRLSALGMLLIFSVASGWNAAYAADSSEADRQAITKIENEWSNAFKTHDKAVLERILADDFVFTDENGGFVKGRVAYIDGLLKGEKLGDFTLSEVLITLHGWTAVVTGIFGAKDAKGAIESTRFTDTFVKEDGGWKAVSSQDTKIK